MEINEVYESYMKLRPGTRVYIPRKPYEIFHMHSEPWVQECTVEEVKQRWYLAYKEEKLEVKVKLYDWNNDYYSAWFRFENLGKTFFLTEKEAEEHLK